MVKPIVAFDVGGLSFIARNGLNAYVVKHGDLKSFGDHLCKLAANLDMRTRFRVATRKVAKAFDLDKTISNYILIYYEALRQT